MAESGQVVAALELVESLDLDRYHYLHSTQAELLRRLDRVDEARAAYDRALEPVHSGSERRFLERRRKELNMSSARAARILARVREIPEGFVRTYGDIDPGAPRASSAGCWPRPTRASRGTAWSAPMEASRREAVSAARCFE